MTDDPKNLHYFSKAQLHANFWRENFNVDSADAKNWFQKEYHAPYEIGLVIAENAYYRMDPTILYMHFKLPAGKQSYVEILQVLSNIAVLLAG